MGQSRRALLVVVVLLACARGEEQVLRTLSGDDSNSVITDDVSPQTFSEHRDKKSIRQRDPIDRSEYVGDFVGEAIGRRGARLSKGMSSSISFAILCLCVSPPSLSWSPTIDAGFVYLTHSLTHVLVRLFGCAFRSGIIVSLCSFSGAGLFTTGSFTVMSSANRAGNDGV